MRLKNVLPTIGGLIIVLTILWLVFFHGRTAQAPHLPVGNVSEAQAFLLPLSEATYLPIRDFNRPDPVLDAKAAGLYDVSSGKWLYGHNVDQRLPIASITKLMTAVVIVENLPLNDSYTVSAEDLNVDGTGSDLVRGEQIKGGDLLKVMLIKSSNDAALTFADRAHQLGIDLVGKMNDKAKTLGMLDTHFADPAGLEDTSGYSTVGDLVRLTRYIDRYPLIWEILTTRLADVSSIDGRYQHHLTTTDRLLEQLDNIIGGKTGYTDGALETMVLQVKITEHQTKLISVILGSHDRFSETKKLIDWGLSAYRW